MNDTVYGKKRDYLRCKSKPSHKWHKIFDNNLIAIRNV